MPGAAGQGLAIPATLPAVPGASLAARYVTGSGNVGGDWYNVFPLPDGKPGIGRVAAILDELTADGTRPGDRPVALAEDACAAVMRNLVGSAPARDDIALLTLHRHSPPCSS